MYEINVFCHSCKRNLWLRVVVLISLFAITLSGCMREVSMEPGADQATPKPSEPEVPIELLQLFDQTVCPDLCWDGVTIGQNEQELVNVVGEYIFRRQEFPDVNMITVDWDVAVHGSDRERFHGTAALSLSEDRIRYLFVPVVDTFPLRMVFDELGQPALLKQLFSDTHFFLLFYPAQRVAFIVRVKTLPPEITGESLVETVILFSEQEAKLFECTRYFRYWAWDAQGDRALPYELPLVPVDEKPEWCRADN